MKTIYENKGLKIVAGNKAQLENNISDEFATIINSKEEPKIILATGNSPVALYKNFINLVNEGKLSFKNVESFNLDEYLDMDDVQFKKYSFREFMNNNLFNHVDIKIENTHFPTEDVLDYDRLLDEKVNKFDWTILGVGSNGHIAFNEPGTPADMRTNIVELKESTIKDNFGDAEDYLTRAVTMGIKDIVGKSGKIILIAWGEAKREALLKILEGNVDEQWPITHLINHENVTIYTDLEDLVK